MKKFDFGQSPWGRYFIEAMEGMADSNRLQRGRSYAGNGDVLELTVSSGLAIAKVAGNYRPFYKVRIQFPPIAGRDAAIVAGLLEEDPMLLARIRAGEIPEAFLSALESAKVHLLPRHWHEMDRSCNCPDDGDPCKHEAAVYYILAKEIDRNPGLLFSLRGMVLPGADTKNGGESHQDECVPDPFNMTMVPAWPKATPSSVPTIPVLTSFATCIPAFLAPLPPIEHLDLPNILTRFYHEVAHQWPRILEPIELEEAEARAWGLSCPRFELSPDGRMQVVTDHWGTEVAITAARRTLGLEGEALSPEMRFLSEWGLAMRSFVAASAFYPDIQAESGRFRAVWKPALFSRAVADYLSNLAAFLPQPAPTAKPIPDRESFLLMLCANLLNDLVAKVRFEPGSALTTQSLAFRAIFRSEWTEYGTPARRSLPKALDTRLAVFELARTRAHYEIRVTTAGAREGKEAEYLLKAGLSGRDGKIEPLSEVAESGGADALAFPALLATFIPALAKLGNRKSVRLSESELRELVTSGAPLLSRLGVTVILPTALTRLARLRRVLTGKTRPGSQNLVSFLDVAAVCDFEWRIEIGGEVVSEKELRELVKQGEALVRFRNQFIRLDPEEAAAVLRRLSDTNEITPIEVLKLALLDEAELPDELKKSFERLISGNALSSQSSVPSNLKTSLRPYQERGFRWLLANLEQGFGAILADDMGLGKTVQAIAAILSLKESQLLGEGALIVVPASLLTNWERELARFAPSLEVLTFYGPGRRKRYNNCREITIVLTSYETLTIDVKLLGDRAWSLIVIDEAHVIKNPEAQKTRAVKSMQSRRKIALSGTPVENKLSELWSIFDFSFPGYLGNLAHFSQRYRSPIEVERSSAAAEELRRVTAPFLLRRLKTDRSIIDDLPEKVVIDEYTELCAEQAALYKAAADNYLDRIEKVEPSERGALIFSLLTALKQIANHPRNYDKESDGTVERSGKSLLLLALLESAIESGEKILIFSQYVEMLYILDSIIQRNLGIACSILHGGLSKSQRESAVDHFQSTPGPGIFLLSLKAGGVGLNLTAATRVIHYDLWFNPAVENQATDRAFRIGQTKNVFVHRLITRGTLEEKIDTIIKSKRELAELAVSSGEKWITKLSTEELRGLIALT